MSAAYTENFCTELQLSQWTIVYAQLSPSLYNIGLGLLHLGLLRVLKCNPCLGFQCVKALHYIPGFIPLPTSSSSSPQLLLRISMTMRHSPTQHHLNRLHQSAHYQNTHHKLIFMTDRDSKGSYIDVFL